MSSKRTLSVLLPLQKRLKAPSRTIPPLPPGLGTQPGPLRSRQPFSARRCRRHNSTRPPSSRQYSFEDVRVKSFISNPSPTRILIDVREPAEVDASGRIPTARNVPVTSSPDGLFLPADDFAERFGFRKPREGDEVVFYCKAGVRSRAAAGMVMQGGGGEEGTWEGVKVGEYPGSWMDWERKGGPVEKK